jgi:hypothetical protein
MFNDTQVIPPPAKGTPLSRLFGWTKPPVADDQAKDAGADTDDDGELPPLPFIKQKRTVVAAAGLGALMMVAAVGVMVSRSAPSSQKALAQEGAPVAAAWTEKGCLAYWTKSVKESESFFGAAAEDKSAPEPGQAGWARTTQFGKTATLVVIWAPAHGDVVAECVSSLSVKAVAPGASVSGEKKKE